MVYFPYDSFIVNAPASQAEVVAALEHVIEPRILWHFPFFSDEPLSYEGKVTAKGFRIFRIPNRSNSRVYAAVHGSFYSDGDETRINVTVRLPVVLWIMLVFMAVWCAFFFFVISGSNGFNLLNLITPAVPLVIYVDLMQHFNQEVLDAETFLHELVDNLKATGNQRTGEKVERLK